MSEVPVDFGAVVSALRNGCADEVVEFVRKNPNYVPSGINMTGSGWDLLNESDAENSHDDDDAEDDDEGDDEDEDDETHEDEKDHEDDEDEYEDFSNEEDDEEDDTDASDGEYEDGDWGDDVSEEEAHQKTLVDHLVGLCCALGQIDVLQSLLSHFEVQLTTIEDHASPIEIAQRFNQPAIVRLLADRVPEDHLTRVIQVALEMGQIDVLEAIWETNCIDLQQQIERMGLLDLIFSDTPHCAANADRDASRVIQWLLEHDLLPYADLTEIMAAALKAEMKSTVCDMLDSFGYDADCDSNTLIFSNTTNFDMQLMLTSRCIDLPGMNQEQRHDFLSNYLDNIHRYFHNDPPQMKAALNIIQQQLDLDPGVLCLQEFSLVDSAISIHDEVLLDLVVTTMQRHAASHPALRRRYEIVAGNQQVQLLLACHRGDKETVFRCLQALRTFFLTNSDERNTNKRSFPRDLLRNLCLRILLSRCHMDLFRSLYGFVFTSISKKTRDQVMGKTLILLIQEMDRIGNVESLRLCVELAQQQPGVMEKKLRRELETICAECSHPEVLRYLLSYLRPKPVVALLEAEFCMADTYSLRQRNLRSRFVDCFAIAIEYLRHESASNKRFRDLATHAKVDMCLNRHVEMQRILHEVYGGFQLQQMSDAHQILHALCKAGCREGIEMCICELLYASPAHVGSSIDFESGSANRDVAGWITADRAGRVASPGGWRRVYRFLTLRDEDDTVVLEGWEVARAYGHEEVSLWLRGKVQEASAKADEEERMCEDRVHEEDKSSRMEI